MHKTPIHGFLDLFYMTRAEIDAGIYGYEVTEEILACVFKKNLTKSPVTVPQGLIQDCEESQATYFSKWKIDMKRVERVLMLIRQRGYFQNENVYIERGNQFYLS